MIKDTSIIRQKLIDILKAQQPSLKIVHDKEEKFEVSGTIETMQGKKKVDGFYFASVIPKPKDVRFYFFPMYTHPDRLSPLSEQLQKCLKGKTCFHVKGLDDALEAEIKGMVEEAISVYREEGLVV